MKRIFLLVVALLLIPLTANSWAAEEGGSSSVSPSVQTGQQAPPAEGLQTGSGGRGSFETKCKTRFQSLDVNKDGMLSEEEFCEPTPRMGCQDHFLQMDGNKDGKVSKEEFKKSRPGKRAEEVFQSKDANGDGSLTQDEFCARRGPTPGQGMQSQ